MNEWSVYVKQGLITALFVASGVFIALHAHEIPEGALAAIFGFLIVIAKLSISPIEGNPKITFHSKRPPPLEKPAPRKDPLLRPEEWTDVPYRLDEETRDVHDVAPKTPKDGNRS